MCLPLGAPGLGSQLKHDDDADMLGETERAVKKK